MVLAPTTPLAEVREPFSASRGPANHGHVRFTLVRFASQGLQSGLAATTTTPSRGSTAEGQQNKLGSYHCNNRIYSIGHGRWLSSDQAKSPAWNLFDYARCNSLLFTDPTGLEDKKDDKKQEKTEAEKEQEAWDKHKQKASDYLDFWLSHMGMVGADGKAISDECKKNLLRIIRMVSWVESKHGTGTGNEPAKDPMQSGNPKDAWWKELSGQSEKGNRFIGGDKCPNYWGGEIADDEGFKKAAKDKKIPEEASDLSRLKDKKEGHKDEKYTAEMSYFWGILYLLHQLREGQFYKCKCDDIDEMITRAKNYNGGGDPEYENKLKKAKELIK